MRHPLFHGPAGHSAGTKSFRRILVGATRRGIHGPVVFCGIRTELLGKGLTRPMLFTHKSLAPGPQPGIPESSSFRNPQADPGAGPLPVLAGENPAGKIFLSTVSPGFRKGTRALRLCFHRYPTGGPEGGVHRKIPVGFGGSTAYFVPPKREGVRPCLNRCGALPRCLGCGPRAWHPGPALPNAKFGM